MALKIAQQIDLLSNDIKNSGNINARDATTANAVSLIIRAGNAAGSAATDADGGDLHLFSGTKKGAGTVGDIFIHAGASMATYGGISITPTEFTLTGVSGQVFQLLQGTDTIQVGSNSAATSLKIWGGLTVLGGLNAGDSDADIVEIKGSFGVSLYNGTADNCYPLLVLPGPTDSLDTAVYFHSESNVGLNSKFIINHDGTFTAGLKDALSGTSIIYDNVTIGESGTNKKNVHVSGALTVGKDHLTGEGVRIEYNSGTQSLDFILVTS